MLQIVENIPAIHATIVGVAAAFFSAFFIYAYQKVTEAQKNLEKVLKTSKDIPIQKSAILGGETSLLDENGNLDWERCKGLIHKATTILSDLNITRSDTNLSTLQEKNHSQTIIEVVKELNHFFNLFFAHYPMDYQTITTTSHATLRTPIHTFDSARYFEILQRIALLGWIWDDSKQSLIQLFDIYDEISQKEYLDGILADIDRQISELDKTSQNYQLEVEKLNLLKQQTYNFVKKMKLSDVLINFFERIEVYRTQVMPALRETLNEFETFNDQFKIKKLTKYFLYTTIYIIVLGIIIPLILFQFITNIGNGYNWIISYIEYFLLLSSFAPYFLVLVYFLKKIENTIFK